MNRRRSLLCLVPVLGLISGAICLIAGPGARADGLPIPAPRIVIYPGDVITDQMLTDISADAIDAPEGVTVQRRSSVVGKMAIRTLLPQRAIPLAAVDNPRLVRNGARVVLTFAENGLTITASGDALQDGTLGQLVKVRNSDSGVTVSGVVQTDGSVKVQGG